MGEKQFKLDTYSLDEWLENDLRASGILNEQNIKKNRNNVSLTNSDSITTRTTTTTNADDSCCGSSTKSSSISILTASSALSTPSEQMQLIPELFSPIQQEQQQSLKRSNDSNDDDSKTRKRQRNTVCEFHKMDTLQTRVKEMELRNKQLHIRATVLESERETALDRQKHNFDRILELEKQLAQAQARLVSQQQQQQP